MGNNYLQLRKILFRGTGKETTLSFRSGINVICGASDTGKSFLAESINFMLGGSKIRNITELKEYGEIELDLVSSNEKNWRLHPSINGGNFKLIDLDDPRSENIVLNEKYVKGKENALSGFLLEQIGLPNKKILKNSTKPQTITRGSHKTNLGTLIKHGFAQ
ncbi:AAA family ATPase [Arsenophonus sp. PmNCSU2021_1]|uniref:AAA family ATPase n=1 Tax=Arsenophonus sp. PmNCSU2021_1 TaxID=3118989 RepID=UPI002FF3FDEF